MRNAKKDKRASTCSEHASIIRSLKQLLGAIYLSVRGKQKHHKTKTSTILEVMCLFGGEWKSLSKDTGIRKQRPAERTRTIIYIKNNKCEQRQYPWRQNCCRGTRQTSAASIVGERGTWPLSASSLALSRDRGHASTATSLVTFAQLPREEVARGEDCAGCAMVSIPVVPDGW